MCDAEKCRMCTWKDSCAAKVVTPPCYVPKNPDVEPYTAPYIPWNLYPSWPWYNPPWYMGPSVIWTNGLAGNTGALGECTCGDASSVAQKGTPVI
jgi:hypothetical protein